MVSFLIGKEAGLGWAECGTSMPRFTGLCFIGLCRCCVFYTLKPRPSTRTKITTRFIVVVWNHPPSYPEVCLYTCFTCLQVAFTSLQGAGHG